MSKVCTCEEDDRIMDEDELEELQQLEEAQLQDKEFEERCFWDKAVIKAMFSLPGWENRPIGSASEAASVADALLDERRKRFGGED